MNKRKRYEDDDNVLRILKDGERMHFSMMAMDSGGEVLPARDAASTINATAPLRVIDAFGRPAGWRPGACYLRPAADGTPERAAQIACDHMRQQAYADSVRDLEDAWRKATPPIDPRANITGVGSGGGRVPDERQDSVPRTMSLADAQAIRDAAYRQYCDELVNAWKAR